MSVLQYQTTMCVQTKSRVYCCEKVARKYAPELYNWKIELNYFHFSLSASLSLSLSLSLFVSHSACLSHHIFCYLAQIIVTLTTRDLDGYSLLVVPR